ncbi:hypothetical protein WICMUC_003044 [Wickerhamomyces mucosus]|uniref:Uncharacterized protein n=1 Tax=Wickerhamomyces mucosus TaxID=1378264 RepID=A0A9P8TDY9_9ASCO|nr:hypothetical protein WICMUC_003044 [Wickerhamomyces mucosus]
MFPRFHTCKQIIPRCRFSISSRSSDYHNNNHHTDKGTINNVNMVNSQMLIEKIRNHNYKLTIDQLKLINDIKLENERNKPLDQYFKNIGFIETDSSITNNNNVKLNNELIDLRQFKNILQQTNSSSNEANHSFKRQRYRIQPNIHEQPKFIPQSKTQNYKMTQAADYIYYVKSNFNYNFNQPTEISRFEYLENSIFALNNNSQSTFTKFISLDLKLLNNELKEIGITIYDSSLNQNSIIPTFNTIHILIDEHFGILSKNNYQCGQSLKLPFKDALVFLKFFLQKNFIFEQNNKLVSYQSSNLIPLLRKLKIEIPFNQNTILDLHNLYMVPFLYVDATFYNNNNNNKDGNNNNVNKRFDSLMKTLPFFMKFESIVKRFNLNLSMDLNNSGNKSYYTMCILLKLLDPNQRSNLKLDDLNHNFEFMEKFLSSEIDHFISNYNSIIPAHDSANACTNNNNGQDMQHLPAKEFDNFKDALKYFANVTIS